MHDSVEEGIQTLWVLAVMLLVMLGLWATKPYWGLSESVTPERPSRAEQVFGRPVTEEEVLRMLEQQEGEIPQALLDELRRDRHGLEYRRRPPVIQKDQEKGIWL